MKKNSYKYGKFTITTYHKKAGEGYEVGMKFGGKAFFVGNFIHAKEANAWYTFMTKELKSFTKRFWINENAPKAWYKNFLTSYFYKKYYEFLEKAFKGYTTQYNRNFSKENRKYTQLKKNWTPKEKPVIRTKKSAA